MGLFGIAVIVCLGGLIIWLIYTYNRFVAKQSKIDGIWDEVDRHLKMRHDLIPNLLDASAGRLPNEKRIFERMEEIARELDKASDTVDIERLENELSEDMRSIRETVASDHPELMMDQKFITTLGELVSMEGQAASACKRHNELVKDFNVSMKQFPANLIVGFLHFQPCEMRIFGVDED